MRGSLVSAGMDILLGGVNRKIPYHGSGRAAPRLAMAVGGWKRLFRQADGFAELRSCPCGGGDRRGEGCRQYLKRGLQHQREPGLSVWIGCRHDLAQKCFAFRAARLSVPENFHCKSRRWAALHVALHRDMGSGPAHVVENRRGQSIIGWSIAIRRAIRTNFHAPRRIERHADGAIAHVADVRVAGRAEYDAALADVRIATAAHPASLDRLTIAVDGIAGDSRPGRDRRRTHRNAHRIAEDEVALDDIT